MPIHKQKPMPAPKCRQVAWLRTNLLTAKSQPERYSGERALGWDGSDRVPHWTARRDNIISIYDHEQSGVKPKYDPFR